MRNLLYAAAAIAPMITTAAQAGIVTTVTPNAGGTNLMIGAGTPGSTILTDFDSVTPGNQPAGFLPATGSIPGGGVVSPANSSLYAAPVGDSTAFYAVAYNPSALPTTPATDTFTLSGQHNYFGLYWGSIDTYNTITFLLNGSPILGGQFTGSDFLPASGSQTAADTNEYVDFNFTGGQTYNGVQFDTSQLNFEFDNMRVDGGIGTTATDVPEPASLVLFGTALLGLGLGRRAIRRNAAV